MEAGIDEFLYLGEFAALDVEPRPGVVLGRLVESVTELLPDSDHQWVRVRETLINVDGKDWGAGHVGTCRSEVGKHKHSRRRWL